jgi:hypothetical protein
VRVDDHGRESAGVPLRLTRTARSA